MVTYAEQNFLLCFVFFFTVYMRWIHLETHWYRQWRNDEVRLRLFADCLKVKVKTSSWRKSLKSSIEAARCIIAAYSIEIDITMLRCDVKHQSWHNSDCQHSETGKIDRMRCENVWVVSCLLGCIFSWDVVGRERGGTSVGTDGWLVAGLCVYVWSPRGSRASCAWWLSCCVCGVRESAHERWWVLLWVGYEVSHTVFGRRHYSLYWRGS